MPCRDTLQPAVGCRGPGGDNICDYCWELEKKDGGGIAKRPRPGAKPVAVQPTTVKTTPVSTGKPPVPPRKVDAQPSPPTGGVKVMPSPPVALRKPIPVPPMRPGQVTALVDKPVTNPVPVKQPAVLPCGKVIPPKPLPPPPPMKLVKLDVSRACGGPGGLWQAVDPVKTVQVKATTAPDAPVAWNKLTWGTNIQDVSRASAGRKHITCSLGSDPPQSVNIDIYDVTALSVSSAVTSADPWKVYESNGDAVVTASTDTDEDKVWGLLQWQSNIVAGPNQNAALKPGTKRNERKVSLSPARDVKVTVTLGCDAEPKKIETTVHICKWPLLEVIEIGFDSREVANDGTAEIGKLFDRKWVKGRPEPAAKKATASVQTVLCYPRNTKIYLWAKFKVVQKPTEEEQVWVAGVTTCKGKTLTWKAQVTVKPADTEVLLTTTASDNPLPDEVAKLDPMTIDWHMTEPDNKTWKKIGSSTHLLYVTLGEPQVTAYWTLLDISCEGAAGKKTENDFVPAAFIPFTTHTGDGNGFKRKGDAVELSYYIKGVDTAYDAWALPNSPYHTKGILSRSDGTGRCGGWADLLKHMFKIHGVTSARDYVIVPKKAWDSVSGAFVEDKEARFLVKNCNFIGNGTLSGRLPYTHKGNSECVKQDGAKGQGKTNPQFDFGDHVFVDHQGKFYDPSYGLGPVVGQFAYEEAAIDGLGSMAWDNPGYTQFNQAGTPQFISKSCSRGYVAHVITATDTITTISGKYSVQASALFDHPLNAALKTLRKDITKLKAGDVLYVPRDWARTKKAVMLLGFYS